jgi:hypothetical protein
MPGQLNTFGNLNALLSKAGNVTDHELRLALRDLATAVLSGGYTPNGLVLDISVAPTDIVVQQQGGGREVFDGQSVYIRAGATLKQYIRVAGTWLAVAAAP